MHETRNGKGPTPMSETGEATATVTPETPTEQTETQPKPTDTVDYWKQRSRENESRAKANADAAKRLAEIEDAQKSEAEKTAERLAKAEQRAAEAEARAVRRELALEHGLSKEDAALLDGVTDETAMKALAARLAAGAAQQRKQGNHVSREGTTTSTGTTQGDDERTFVRSLFGGGTT